MDLDTMKYAELRSLAKELGLKANMKADKLLKAIKELYAKQKQEDEKVSENDAIIVEEDKKAKVDEDGEVDAPSTSTNQGMFVNTRRGKGSRTKRKIPETETVTKAETEVAEVEAVCVTAVAKRRRLSSTRDTDQTEADLPQETTSTGSEQKPDMKDEAPVPCNTDAPKVAKRGRIPRHQGLQKKSKSSLNPVTPNFKKLHEAQFNKMESIDSYYQRKTKQVESHKAAVKEVKPNPSTSLFSPISAVKVEDKRRHTAISKKPAVKEDAVFKPSVLSTRRINVRFSQATRDNEKNKTLVKTPSRMSACIASSTPKTNTANGGKPNILKTSTLSATKTPGAFIFSGNANVTITPGTQKKPSFDLKASLSRPLTYKPHKGKLKAFGEPKENAAVNQSVVLNSHQKNYKQHQVQTRENRRTKQTEDRKQKKENLLGARRGLVMM